MMIKGASHRIFWIVGFLVLLVSALGASWALNQPSAGADQGSKSTSSSAASAFNGEGIIAYGYVDVEERVLQLNPTQSGRVLWVVIEGKECEKDEVLLQLDDRQQKLKVDQARADLEIAKSKLIQAEKLVNQLEADKTALEASIDAYQFQADLAEKSRESLEKLRKDKTISEHDYQMVEIKTKLAQAQLKAEKAKLNKLNELMPELAIKVAQDNKAAKEAQLKEAELAVEECKILAPVKGRMLRVQTATGELAGPQSPKVALQFCPEGKRIVRAEVLQDWASKVKVGQPCTIEDDSISGISWQGKVTQVSDWYAHKRSIIQEPFQINDVRTLECLVSIDSGTQPVRIGQRLRVTIKQGGT
jgi:multidrug resistance efflux pump